MAVASIQTRQHTQERRNRPPDIVHEAVMTNPNWWRLRTVSRNDCDPADYVRRPFNEWREIPSTALDRPEMRDVLVNALQSLAPEYREVFMAHDMHGLTLCETCAVLGLASATVRLRLRRARLILTDVLARNSSGGRA
jgi:DNA-directed RNA polymerase specialized sigma24 family protein